MSKRTKIVAIVLMVAAIVSCSKNKQPVDYDPQLLLQAYTLPLTRYSGDAGFDTGDVVGVYVVKRNATNNDLSVSGNYVDNQRFINEYSVSQGNILKPEVGKEVYLVEGDIYDIYSYYPYTANLTTVTQIPFSVRVNQSSEANLLGSDFLWAKTVNVTHKVAPVQVQYKHLFSQLIVSLVAGEGYTNEEISKFLTGIEFKDVLTDAKINISEGKSVAGIQTNTVIPNRESAGSNSFRAIIIPQVVTDSKPLVDIEIGGKHYPVSLNLDFKPGRSYRMSVNVSREYAKTVVTLNGVVSWDTETLPDGDISVEKPVNSNIKKYCDITFSTADGSAYLDGATVGSFECESGAETSYFDYAHNSAIVASVTNWMDVLVKLKNIDLPLETKYAVCVHVDWNNDGDFEDEKELVDRQVTFTGQVNYVQTLSFPLDIPTGAVSPTTLRIVGGLESGTSINHGCGNANMGTVYDVAIAF